LIAEQGETDWRWRSWHDDATLIEDIPFNIGKHLEKKGVKP
jgi:hypothetical protein